MSSDMIILSPETKLEKEDGVECVYFACIL